MADSPLERIAHLEEAMQMLRSMAERAGGPQATLDGITLADWERMTRKGTIDPQDLLVMRNDRLRRPKQPTTPPPQQTPSATRIVSPVTPAPGGKVSTAPETPAPVPTQHAPPIATVPLPPNPRLNVPESPPIRPKRSVPIATPYLPPLQQAMAAYSAAEKAHQDALQSQGATKPTVPPTSTVQPPTRQPPTNRASVPIPPRLSPNSAHLGQLKHLRKGVEKMQKVHGERFTPEHRLWGTPISDWDRMIQKGTLPKSAIKTLSTDMLRLGSISPPRSAPSGSGTPPPSRPSATPGALPPIRDLPPSTSPAPVPAKRFDSVKEFGKGFLEGLLPGANQAFGLSGNKTGSETSKGLGGNNNEMLVLLRKISEGIDKLVQGESNKIVGGQTQKYAGWQSMEPIGFEDWKD